MKKTAVILTTLGLFLGSTVMAQKASSSGISAKAAVNADQLRARNTGPTPLQIRPSGDMGAKSETWGASNNNGNPINRNTIVNKPENRPVSPQLKSDDGIIHIDFGIVQEGDNFPTFFPFNINTLEREETVATPVIKRSDYIRYSSINGGASGVTDVKLTNGTKFHRGANTVMNGNGFNLEYNADKPGAVDESVIVYTTKGNIIYRLTGYVLSKETGVTVVDKK